MPRLWDKGKMHAQSGAWPGMRLCVLKVAGRSGKVGLYNPSHDPDAQHVAAGFDVFPARF